MPIIRSPRRISRARILAIAAELLDSSVLCAIATVTSRGAAYINTAYFAWDVDLSCIWLSDADATHSRNLTANRQAAIAVYDPSQAWGEADRGIQLFGSARRVTGQAAREAEATYARRFARYRPEDVSGYDFFRFRPRRLKLFDERSLGDGVSVTAIVRATGVEWERTEIYDPTRGPDDSR